MTRLVPPGSLDEGRFPAGTVLVGRYRVIGLLGRGGMGEVYRANDLKLGQPVALKFLPEATASDSQLRARFHAEVRIARQVSHPNVCRVYDIGEVNGATFLSMEYVDGEDLRSLLRRIGRLPADKALEIARRLCAGLAAAHDKGVLHRDLKPANIMIDGRGHVLIADFGLAGLAGQIAGVQLRDGTPAYMAPEQLAGTDVSVRSDIYALGLVLYEMFTGTPAFERGAPRATPTSVTSSGRSSGKAVKDVDPAVERVILSCLEVDPRNRPASALAVAAALPGGDPVAAALAAGETPSPEMVAASGEVGISTKAAQLWLAWILVGLIAVAVLGGRTNVFAKTPFENSPEILAQKARDLIQSLGYTEPSADRASGFLYDLDYQRYAEEHETLATYRAQVTNGQPPLIYFWYRQSPQYLEGVGDGVVTPENPPPVSSGMIQANLDPRGRLIFFSAVPAQVEGDATPARPVEWAPLLNAAGIDLTRFAPAEPRWVPLVSFDRRAAWTGSLAHAPEVPLRVEAASWRGRPVSFQVIGPWSVPARMQSRALATGRSSPTIAFGTLFAVSALALVLAWRNFRLHKSDVRGASRVAAVVLCCETLAWMFTARHTPTGREFISFTAGAGAATFVAAAFWVLYVALEPYVRRSWPQSLVTWGRLLGGRVRDPLVGAHLLIGVALGVAAALAYMVRRLLLSEVGAFDTFSTVALDLNSVLDSRHIAGLFSSGTVVAIGLAMAMFFSFFLLRALLRRQWLWVAVGTLIGAGSVFQNSFSHPVIWTASSAVVFGLTIFLVTRFGMLANVAAIFVAFRLTGFPLTTDFSPWYAGSTIVALVVVLALTGFAFHTAVAGRPLFKEGFLEAD